MTGEAARKLEIFFRSVAAAPQSLLLLDYDGTLAGFRVNRFKARPWAGIPELLKQIQDRGRTRLAVITGRPPEEIPPMLGLSASPEVWGLHGARRLYPDGRFEMEEQAPQVRHVLDELRAKLKSDSLGGMFEDKANAVVMHWRGHALRSAKQIERKTRALFAPAAKIEGLRLMEFEAGLELRAGRDKGGAVKEILREVGGNVPVAYLGDDLTDELAFAAVNAANAPRLSVLMRRARRKTAADVWMRPPEEMRAFLKKWVDAQGTLRAN